MRKIKLVLEYDGSKYHGWQFQRNGISIQEAVEKILTRVTKEKTNIVGSGRTDAGVHAEAQVAHFVTHSRMKGEEFLKALNSLLPRDIVVKQVEEVPIEFDARRSATRKIYRYTILNQDHPSAFDYGRSMYIQYPLDVPAMKQAVPHLLGRHDFTSFQGPNSEVKSSVRELYRIDIERNKNYIVLYFEGNGFLKYMVRNIVGTLVEVGKGRMQPGRVREILELRDRKKAGPTAQPQGLCLVKVFYEGNGTGEEDDE